MTRPGGVLMLSLLAACGYVGDPQPPALRIPVAVSDLAAVERGDRIIIQCTLPAKTTEGLVLDRFGEVDLRVGPAVNPWHLPTWEDGSRRVDIPGVPAPGPLRMETAAADWVGREVTLSVRLANTRGRFSDWSNFVSLTVAPPLATPADLHVEQVREGVRVNWTEPNAPPGTVFRVFRRSEQTQVQLGQTDKPEWLDTTIQYEETYHYLVQAVTPAGSGVAESEPTAPAEVRPTDIFPPPAPAGFTAVTGINAIELTWDRSEDTGPVVYRLYRAEADGPLELIADSLTLPVYSDPAVRTGRRYRYAVSAVDEAGNESGRSATIEQTAP